MISSHEALVMGGKAGIVSERFEWIIWNNHRLEAEREGRPFNEPIPEARTEHIAGLIEQLLKVRKKRKKWEDYTNSA